MKDRMITTKRLVFRSSSYLVEACVSEVVSSKFQSTTWPGALVLSSWLVANRAEVEKKRVLELCCGTALVGVVAALLGAISVACTDRDDSEMLKNVKRSISLNEGLHTCVLTAAPYDYTNYDNDNDPLRHESFDLIVGADVLYSGENFDDVLFAVAGLLAAAKGSSFLTAYQERSPHRCLAAHLEKYSLVAEVMDYVIEDGAVIELRDGGKEVEVATRTFSSIHLIRISRA